ncbi:4'-phosphopantetheinyl transferase family protein [Georgenia faecalis]|uniref:4'-phosphopantetheinyl transferase family protein n=1 Tax=Georgenia faecalis TaxID=2483799 RepID=A0ABV9D826_9MICO|nr:4'-phosphopantetheinyl transferase superfamily protein [Georgenia faecalis]
MRARPERRGTVTCEVWWATPSGATALAALLEAAEHRRAERLRDHDRARFVTARALLRLVLAARTGTAPSELRLDTTCYRCGAGHGKPRLVGGDGSVSFSIAHSGDRVVVAVADGTAIGVDVEVGAGTGAEELMSLGASILAPAELADYWRLEPSRRPRALAVWWTRKEAVLKATGDGLTVPMRSLAVTTPDEPAALRSTGRARSSTAAMAVLHDLAADERTVACVAALGVASLTVVERDGDRLLASATAPAATGRA